MQFDWDGDFPPRIPQKDLVVYEMHVRGFTKHSSSEVDYPGTYIGLVEKLTYLKVIILPAEDITVYYWEIQVHYFLKLRVLLITVNLSYFDSELKARLSLKYAKLCDSY